MTRDPAPQFRRHAPDLYKDTWTEADTEEVQSLMPDDRKATGSRDHDAADVRSARVLSGCSAHATMDILQRRLHERR